MGRVKLNADGSSHDGVDGTGMLLRDHVDNIILSSCRLLLHVMMLWSVKPSNQGGPHVSIAVEQPFN